MTRVRNSANIREVSVAVTEVIFFQEGEGKTPPLIEWLDGLPLKLQQKCLARLKRPSNAIYSETRSCPLQNKSSFTSIP